MDRLIVQPGAIPLDTDILTPQQNTMVAMGALMASTFGTGTVVDGLAVTPGTGLTVQVAPGAIYSYTSLEAQPYGSLPADTSDSIVKCGINTQPLTTATLNTPGTVGQVINYLVEAQYLESDALPVVLPYYNPASPGTSFSGPNNSGNASNTARQQRVSIQLKAGNAATAGSQVTPGADSGWTPIAIITVPYGVVSLAAGNIVRHPSAPFIPTKLPQLRRKLTANLTLYVSTSGNDANSGFAPWNAFATMQAAWNFIVGQLDLASSYSVNISLSAGTYTTGLAAGGGVVGFNGTNVVTITGAGTANTFITTTNSHGIQASSGAAISVSGFTISSTGTTGGVPATCIVAVNQASIGFQNVTFGAAGIQIWSTQSATISASGPFSVIAGAVTAHMQASANAQILITNATVTVYNNPTFGVFVACATALIQCLNSTYAGTATCPKFSVSNNGVINVNGASGAYFPGTVVGAQGAGGQYV